MRQEWGNQRLDFLYDDANQPLAVIYTNGNSAPSIYYYVLNVQGDVVALSNASGEIVAEYFYDPWGAPVDNSGKSIFQVETENPIRELNPLRYRGYYYDSETGFYYLQSRYYDPFIGRFISADTFATTDADGILSCNMFAYCENNPVMRSDASGEFWNIIGGGIIGGIINTYTSFVFAKISGQSFTAADALISFTSGAITGAVAATGLGAIYQGLVGAAVGAAGSIASDLAGPTHTVDLKKAGVYAAAGFAGGLIGGDGIQKKGGALATAKQTLDKVTAAKNAGMKFARQTATKAVKRATQTFKEVYVTQSFITAGRFLLGAFGANIYIKARGY